MICKICGHFSLYMLNSHLNTWNKRQILVPDVAILRNSLEGILFEVTDLHYHIQTKNLSYQMLIRCDHIVTNTKIKQISVFKSGIRIYKQIRIVASNEIQFDTRFVLFGIRQSDIPAFQSKCSHLTFDFVLVIWMLEILQWPKSSL